MKFAIKIKRPKITCFLAKPILDGQLYLSNMIEDERRAMAMTFEEAAAQYKLFVVLLHNNPNNINGFLINHVSIVVIEDFKSGSVNLSLMSDVDSAVGDHG